MNKPIYGTKDAGRRFYKTFRRRATEVGLTECRLCRSPYAYYDQNQRLVVLAGAHVDDFLWAADHDYDKVMLEHLFQHFQLNQVEEGSFRFCGR